MVSKKSEKDLPPAFYLRAQKKYGGRYVARKSSRVLASAKNLKELLKIMKSRKIVHQGNVSIGYVPPSHSSHVFIYR
ncbi:MAG: hypothetical protein HY073_02045 [Deltaproteobacteria bacterium]|nr:hypothetical protein [Deltaproteobacteria bacterium]